MPFFQSEEGTATEGIHYCVNRDCELWEMQQPQTAGHSIAAFGNDGSITVIRKGGFSQNEENLMGVRNMLVKHLPETIEICKTVSDREMGADLVLSCSICEIKREIQVTRVLDSGYARTSGRSDVAWKKYSALQILENLLESISKKSARYSAFDIANMILILDPTVDVFWSVILRMNLTKLRDHLAENDWFSIVMLSPEHVIRLGGSDLRGWCNCP